VKTVLMQAELLCADCVAVSTDAWPGGHPVADAVNAAADSGCQQIAVVQATDAQ
jgi:hypothetical protein